MSVQDYRIVVERLSDGDGGGFAAYVPDLPGCMSEGETRSEAVANAEEAILDWIEKAKSMGRPIPDLVPVRLHAKVYVHPGRWLAEEIVGPANIEGRLAGLSRALGVTRQALSALLNGRADVSADMAVRFEKAFGIRADTLMRMQAAYDLGARGPEHEG